MPFIESPQAQQRLVLAAFLVYLVGFVAWWPNAILVSDEGSYIGQAVVFATKHTKVPLFDPASDTVRVAPVSTYPAGTSLLQAPFVALGGWRAACLASLASLGVTLLLLVRWLRQAQRPPLFAALVLLYPPVLVMSRVGMSELPSAAVVMVGWLLFWRGLRGARWAWLASGFVAGVSVLWREPNAVLFVPLFAGAVVRRERAAWQLVVGGAAGLALRVAVTWLVFDNPLYIRNLPSGAFFSPPHLGQTVVLYLFALLVLVPGGGVGLLLYRGERRPEIIATGLLFFFFYCIYYYDGSESAVAMRIILGPRFFIPLVPILAFALSESVPRLAVRISPALVKGGTAALAAGLFVELIAVHPVLYSRGAVQARMRDALYSETRNDSIVLTNQMNAAKMESYAYGTRHFVPRGLAPLEKVIEWSRQPNGLFMAFIDRTDSAARVEDAALNAVFEETVRKACRVQVLRDEKESAIEHLYIASVMDCSNTVADAPVRKALP